MLAPIVLFLALLSPFVDCLNIIVKSFIFSEAGIEAIFDIVVDSTWHVLLDLNPLVTIFLMEVHKLQILGNRPFLLVEIWINIIVPSLATLLSDTPRQKSCYFLPFLKAIFCNFISQDHIFFWGPVTLYLLNCAILSIFTEQKPPIHAVDFRFMLIEDHLLSGRHLVFLFIDVFIDFFMYYFNIFNLILLRELHK